MQPCLCGQRWCKQFFKIGFVNSLQEYFIVGDPKPLVFAHCMLTQTDKNKNAKTSTNN